MADQKTNVDVDKDETLSTVDTPTRSPRTHVDSSPLPTDSMVTVPLSEADAGADEDEEGSRDLTARPDIIVEERRASSRTNSSEIRKAFGRHDSQTSVDTAAIESPDLCLHEADAPVSPRPSHSRNNSEDSVKSQPVDWAELEKKEEQQPEAEGEEEVWFLPIAFFAYPLPSPY